MSPNRILLLLFAAIGLSGCVGAAAGGPEMSFRRVNLQEGAGCKGNDCASVIAAQGRVTRDTPQLFAEFVRSELPRAPMRNVVVLSSPGGHVGASLELGLMLRALGTTVLVGKAEANDTGAVSALGPSNCYSACAYTLMGAKNRIVPSGSKVGVHRMHGFGNAIDPTREQAGQRFLTAGGREVDALKRYVAAVGVDPRLIDLAETVSPDDIHILSTEDMRRFRMAVDRPF